MAQLYQRNLYIVEKYFHCETIPSLTMRAYLHSFSRSSSRCSSQTSQLAQNSEKIWTYSSSRSSKVDDFGTNGKRICDFLLVINSNFGPILHVSEIRRLIGWKLRIFLTLFFFGALARSLCFLWNFALKLSVRKPDHGATLWWRLR